MLLIPLVTGAAIGLADGGRVVPVLLLTTAVLALFWLRTPVESWLVTNGVRVQTREDRQLVGKVLLPLAAIAVASLTGLFWNGKNPELITLGVIVLPVFAGQVVLKKMGRTTRIAAEVLGAVALTSTASAAYYVSTGRFDTNALTLWLLNWLFAADQVYFVWLRIRGARITGWRNKIVVGWRFLAGQIVLGVALVLGCRLGWLREMALMAFVPVLFRGFAWFARKTQPIVVRRLGWTELTHAVVFGVLLVVGFTLIR